MEGEGEALHKVAELHAGLVAALIMHMTETGASREKMNSFLEKVSDTNEHSEIFLPLQDLVRAHLAAVGRTMSAG